MHQYWAKRGKHEDSVFLFKAISCLADFFFIHCKQTLRAEALITHTYTHTHSATHTHTHTQPHTHTHTTRGVHWLPVTLYCDSLPWRSLAVDRSIYFHYLYLCWLQSSFTEQAFQGRSPYFVATCQTCYQFVSWHKHDFNVVTAVYWFYSDLCVCMCVCVCVCGVLFFLRLVNSFVGLVIQDRGYFVRNRRRWVCDTSTWKRLNVFISFLNIFYTVGTIC